MVVFRAVLRRAVLGRVRFLRRLRGRLLRVLLRRRRRFVGVVVLGVVGRRLIVGLRISLLLVTGVLRILGWRDLLVLPGALLLLRRRRLDLRVLGVGVVVLLRLVIVPVRLVRGLVLARVLRLTLLVVVLLRLRCGDSEDDGLLLEGQHLGLQRGFNLAH